MAFLKRKRSESEFSCSSSSSSFSSPTKTAPAHALLQRHLTPAHLPSRTMKRHRDSRPSEQMIHQRTLDLLYDAQKQRQPGPGPSPPLAQPPSGPVFSEPPPPAAQQPSLHSFWNLPGPSHAPATAASPSVAPGPSPGDAALDAPRHCEDCGHLLRAEAAGGGGYDDDDAMDTDMDLELDGYGAGPADTGCGACGKHVCSHCSVSHLGEQRRCLLCAGTSPHARKKDEVGMARLFGWRGARPHAMC